jgi:transmembrane sensor
MWTERRIIELLIKRLQSALSDDEERELSSWRAASPANEALFQEVTSARYLDEGLRAFGLHDAEEPWQRMQQHMQRGRSKRRRLYYMSAAASVLILFGLLFLWQRHSSVEGTDIRPGAAKAQLILQDGSRIDLDSLTVGQTANGHGITVTKDAKGKVTCRYADSAALASNTLRAHVNIITTPAGGEYQIVLPDGSVVDLNAMSSLKFPSAFSSNERRVSVTGEAYFDVKADHRRPFRIMINDHHEINVLGTKFNVLAYEDEPLIRTTLIEGAIRVRTAMHQQVLKPGQEAQIDRASQQLNVTEADMAGAVAWKNGYFIFSNESIESIMRKVGRWYNVEVVYQGNIKNKTFGGTFSKSKSLKQLLKSFESTGSIRYKIAGRKVMIMAE